MTERNTSSRQSIRTATPRTMLCQYLTICSCVLLLCPSLTYAFAPHVKRSIVPIEVASTTSTASTVLKAVTDANEESTFIELQVVLFGTGDYRTHDHEGLSKALQLSRKSCGNSSKILPLVILDKDTLSNVPMARGHTMDTATILHSSLSNLKSQLSSSLDLNLHVVTKADTIVDGLQTLIQNHVDITSWKNGLEKVTVHVCDLGQVDNELGYGPYGQLLQSSSQTRLDKDEYIEWDIQTWNCHLRSQPWQELDSDNGWEEFPQSFVEYDSRYLKKNEAKPPMSAVARIEEENLDGMCIPSLTKVPSEQDIAQLLCIALDFPQDSKSLESNSNTGLYATHWGGLKPHTLTYDSIERALHIFLCTMDSHKYKNGFMDGDEALVQELSWWEKGQSLKRNPSSLEHATLEWNIYGSDDNKSSAVGNLIEGELLTRYLAAPLLFGLVSPRYLWTLAYQRKCRDESQATLLEQYIPKIFKSKQTAQAAMTLVESREWHKLFATRCIKSRTNKMDISYSYWRWHGFLCRYGTLTLEETAIDKATKGNESTKTGLVLVHGFGASGTQWEKSIKELSKKFKSTTQTMEVLVPDLIGFGQSEKPSLTYTQYMWESYTLGLVKDVGLMKKGWDSYLIGGNSIGGYTSMGVAADDSLSASEFLPTTDKTRYVSASGAMGTQSCEGLVLMNSAGKVLSKEELQGKETIQSVAEATALDTLGEFR